MLREMLWGECALACRRPRPPGLSEPVMDQSNVTPDLQSLPGFAAHPPTPSIMKTTFPLRSLAPVIDHRTRVLVLGTMPGAASLARQKYYAHPRNRFWRLMEEIAGVAEAAPYGDRIQGLLAARIGLWDTLKACERRGSLDTAIRNAVPNDLGGLLDEHSTVSAIGLNGAKAADVFRRMILPTLAEAVAARLTVVPLPSTSPANARGGFEALMAKWTVLGDRVDASARNAVQ